jgi:hypothetical protein
LAGDTALLSIDVQERGAQAVVGYLKYAAFKAEASVFVLLQPQDFEKREFRLETLYLPHRPHVARLSRFTVEPSVEPSLRAGESLQNLGAPPSPLPSP